MWYMKGDLSVAQGTNTCCSGSALEKRLDLVPSPSQDFRKSLVEGSIYVGSISM